MCNKYHRLDQWLSTTKDWYNNKNSFSTISVGVQNTPCVYSQEQYIILLKYSEGIQA
jgi:hypothetical protein